MKRIISLILVLASLLTLASCGNKYEPVPSTEEEARVVMTLSLDGKKYDVKYELYRAMFLTYKAEVDGGDSSVWSGDNKDEYIEKVHGMILARVTDIYATLHHASTIGIDVYSKSVDSKIKEYIKTSVEGGSYDGEATSGYESYDAYLNALAKMGINYSVQELIFRYSIALEMISEYYIGTPTEDLIGNVSYSGGKLAYTEEDIRQFYFSDDSVRYISAYVQSQYPGALDRARSLYNKLKGLEGDDDAVAIAINANSISADADLNAGSIIGRYVLDNENYGAITEAAFSTPIGRVSNIIETTLGEATGYFIIYPISKSETHFKNYYEDIVAVYLENEIGELITNTQNKLMESAVTTSVLENLDYASITYPTVNRK